MEKPFLDIQDQIERLKERGLEVDEHTKEVLLREGYYSIINGYKTPFIDKQRTEEACDDRFKEGTTFNDIYALFTFDRELREVTFKYLMQVEAVVRTVCSYTFAEAHQEPAGYLIQSNFCTESEFKEFGLKDYIDNLLRLQSTLYNAVTRPRNDAVKHYKKHQGWVPLWVLSKTLTFGSIEHFFHFMKPAERRLVCKRIAEATGRAGGDNPYFDPKDARLSLDPLVKFRNICAHDERLYCAKVGHRDPIIDYASMLDLAEPYLSREDYESFLCNVVLTVVAYNEKSSIAIHVLEESGVERILDKAADAAFNQLDHDDTRAKLGRFRRFMGPSALSS